MEFHILLFIFNFLLQYCASKSINVAVLLPFDENRLFSVKHIAPAITLAIEKIVENPMYAVNNLSVRYADTKCDIAFGINHAIEFYMYNQVDAFFGPVCDFAVAPVARQVMFWNLPVISGGAMARDFIMYKNTTYGMLTRVGPINFQTLSMLVVNMLTVFKWNRLKLLYDSSGQDYIVTGFCHLLTEALHYDLLSVQPVIEQDYFRVDEGVDIEQLLSREVGLQYSVTLSGRRPSYKAKCNKNMHFGIFWTVQLGYMTYFGFKYGVDAKGIVNFAVISPTNEERLFSTKQVAPVIDYAISRVQRLGLLPNITIHVRYGDSKCNSKDAPIQAFDFYRNGLVSVFLGPVCDYSLAPVARYAPYWNKPVISPGGFAHDFGVGKRTNDSEYRTLTRVGATFNSLARTVIGLVQHYEWHRIKVIYDGEGHTNVMPRFCFLAASSFVSYSKKKRLDYDFHIFIPKIHKVEDMLREEVGNLYNSPACDYAVAPIARFAYYWNIPVITAGALVSAFHDKSEYKLLTRIMGTYAKIGHFVEDTFSVFNWSTVGLLYTNSKGPNDGRSNCYFAVEPLFIAMLKKSGNEPWYTSFNEHSPDVDYAKHLKEASLHTRVIILCASPSSIREIMIKAHELNFDNGEYVFFNIDLFSSKNASERPWYKADDTPERNQAARQAYEALMTVTLRKPTSPEYRKFSEEVKRRASKMYANFTYGEEEVNSFVGAFHDAVILYAIALNETLEANGSVSDGKAITDRMWNRTFSGITGTVSIDANGDRNADYSLLDLNPKTDKFEVVANYYGNRKRYEPVKGKRIHWAGNRGGPPKDTPVCGFDGSKCPPEEPFPEYGIVIIVLGSVLLVVLIVTFFVYRHIKLEAELAEMNWRVKYEDIMFGAPTKNRKLERCGSRMSLIRRNSVTSSVSGDTIAIHLDNGNKQLFTKTGYYKGAINAIKQINKQHITIHKPLLMEVKKIKDLQNDHLVRFVGACIDPPHCCVLTEYCPKGSLQDVLENDELQLDWMFRYSIMQDIVRGMAYLQGTDVHSHGNLKSTNCVVDSRFVVKLTDFGLHKLREPDEDTIDVTSYAFFRSKLWTAPELLRMFNKPPEGTKSGDVYSFAIICQEIVYRKGVFYLQNLDMAPQEILTKVKNGMKPYFRPTLEEFDCPCDELAGVIRRCWSEDPAERPDFHSLKNIIRKLNKDGDKGDILDNLLSRMEQYANNLEALVEERTGDYLEQKKRAEDLLYMMLPKKIAAQLIQGEPIKAESYEHTTIYFSDIVGFTALSAASTPMQVVDLLNDLYTIFDCVIENYDVYKVETIGDAYMVVSGLPVRNGNLHAREIARMSLNLLNKVLSFRISHRPNDQLKLRIGIHTGSVVAGVVGKKMPRYCLFGDTVNTASRMESNGQPQRIHVSPECRAVLDTFGTFELELRGPVEMKGKGAIITSWLVGEREARP